MINSFLSKYDYTKIEPLTDHWIVHCKNLRARYVSTSGNSFNFRLDWLKNIFSQLEVYDINFQETFALSLASNDYDVLFVGATDSSRIINFAKRNALALVNRARFAIMDETNPLRRAKILNAGFDEVFDLSRVTPDEAAMRIAAVRKRYQLVKEQHALRTEGQVAVNSVTSGGDLRPKDMLLLQALCERIGQPVSYQRLSYICSNDHEAITFNHLKVLMSNARKQLNSYYSIKSIGGHSYVIQRIH